MSTALNFTVDANGPAINVSSLASVANVTNTTVVFNFTVTDAVSTTTNCSLYINTLLNQTNGSVANNTAFNWTLPMANGTYGWNITCVEAAPFNTTVTSSVGSLFIGNLGANALLNTTTNVTTKLIA